MKVTTKEEVVIVQGCTTVTLIMLVLLHQTCLTFYPKAEQF